MSDRRARIDICLDFSGEAGACPAEIAEALTRAGLGVRAADPAAPGGPGVLFFAEVTPPLCEGVRRASRNGLERVLAVAATGAALARGGSWRLLQAGAGDVLAWDQSEDPAGDVAARFERWEAVDRLVRSPLVQNNLVGRSPAWVAALRRVVEVAHFTDAPVLITGESGTGKELAARLIHTLDPRPAKRDLVLLDCTTVVPELSGSEFFGHERGAFTGAVAARDGAFALADGGTLFLDEVGELPLPLQAELLRAVQEHTYKRVGSNDWQQTRFRLVCATNRDLRREEAQGRFRRDFYYRIAAWPCPLPPLRERPEDILPLVDHFLRQFRPGREPPPLDEAVRDYLLRRQYPGNVRDLRQLVARLASRHVGPGPITTGDVPEEERPAAEGGPEDWHAGPFEGAIRRALVLGVGLKEIGRATEDLAVRIAVDNAEGSLQRAARALGVTDRALQLRRAAGRRGPTGGDELVG
jgi:transcriptional regulator with GAF, ATPase, and Fis domain